MIERTEFTTTHSSPQTALDAEEIYQLVKRGDIDPHAVERVGARALEVSVLWQSAILHVAHLEGARDFVLADADAPRVPAGRALLGGLAGGSTLIAAGAATGSLAIGAVGALVALAGAGSGIALDTRNTRARRDPSRFVVGSEVLGDHHALRVVRNDQGRARFVFVPGADGDVESNGKTRTLAQLVADGACTRSEELDGAMEIEIVPDARYRLRVGALTILARIVAPARTVAAGSRRDPAALAAGIGAFAAVATMLGAALFASSDGGYLMADTTEQQLHDIQSIMQLAHDRPDAPRASDAHAAGSSPAIGARHAGTEGAAGRPDTAVRNRRMAIPDRNRPPHLGATAAREAVAHRGIFFAVNAPGGAEVVTAENAFPFGDGEASGHDAVAANGSIDGELPGDALGMGGLGRLGPGIGGGGHDEQTIGVGSVCSERGCGAGTFASTVGHHLANRQDTVTVRPGPMVSDGALAPDAIRRVVLRNLGQVTHCQEQGMSRDPRLEGRVVVRFIIGGTGSVLASAVGNGSTIQDAQTSQCIASAVRRWQFPTPVGEGVVSVTYPFNLQPAL